MICPTCNGKGIRFEPVLMGDQYEAIPRPCPDCGDAKSANELFDSVDRGRGDDDQVGGSAVRDR